MVTPSLFIAAGAAAGADLAVGALPALSIALGVAVVVAFAEWRHRGKVRRVGRLAFGPLGSPSAWVRAVPLLRTAAAALAAWGLLVLAGYDPVQVDRHPARGTSKQLLIALDASPSMHLKDAGPDPEKISRAEWAGRVVHGILDRLDMESTRISIAAFYTDMLPIVQETFDKEVVRNALDGLPMYVAFEPGPTKVHEGVRKALEIARPWKRDSAILVVVSDGDAGDASGPIRLPDSIADAIVIGVGSSTRGMSIAGRSSRQDANSLKQLAARLGGTYHDGNTRHLPSRVLDGLTMVRPRGDGLIGLRDLALLCTAVGCGTLALLGPALALFGRRRDFAGARRRLAQPRPRGEGLGPRQRPGLHSTVA
jgi:Ca-activated chloride channel family protein